MNTIDSTLKLGVAVWIVLGLQTLVTGSASAQCVGTLTVNTTLDDVTNGNGLLSLREAIQTANAQMSSCDTRVNFDLPSSQQTAGHFVMSPSSGQPWPVSVGALWIDGDDVSIDGVPQGASSETAPPFMPGTGRARIELRGNDQALTGLSFSCLASYAGRPTGLRGLAFNGFLIEDVRVEGCDGLTIAGSSFGTDWQGTGLPPTGSDAQPSHHIIVLSSDGVTIGGPNPADRVVMTSGSSAGIFLWREAVGTVIENVQVGVGRDGMPLGEPGIQGLWMATGTVTGTSVTHAWLADALNFGVLIEGGSQGHQLSDNRIVGARLAAVRLADGSRAGVTWGQSGLTPDSPVLTSGGLPIDVGAEGPDGAASAIGWVGWTSASTVEGALPAMGSFVYAGVFGAESCDAGAQGERYLGQASIGGDRRVIYTHRDGFGQPSTIPSPFVSIFLVEDLGGAGQLVHELSSCLSSPPTLEVPGQQRLAAGVASDVTFVASDLQTASADLDIRVRSDRQALLPDANLGATFVGGTTWNLRLTPVNGQSGQANVTLTAIDGNGSVATGTFGVVVNDPPHLALPATASGMEDGEVTIAPVSVADADASTLSVTLAVDRGTFTLSTISGLTFQQGDGSSDAAMAFSGSTAAVGAAVATLFFRLPANESGGATLSMTVSDGIESAMGQTALSVTPANDPPIANPDTASTSEDELLEVLAQGGLLGNDTDLDGDTLVVTSATLDATLGGVMVDPDGAFRYDPTAASALQALDDGEQRVDTFQYTIGDGQGGSAEATVTITVHGRNDAPTVGAIGPQRTSEDSPLTVPFTIDDLETPAGSLTVTASSSNPTVVPSSNIVVGGSGGERSLTITPAADQVGETTITITVRDATLMTTAAFLLTVEPRNDPPTLGAVQDVTTAEDTPTAAIPIVVADTDDPLDGLELSGSVEDGALVQSMVFGGSGGQRTLVITPAPNVSGATRVTVAVTDGRNTVNTSFGLSITPVNDPPTLTGLSDQTLDEDATSPLWTFEVADLETPAADLSVSITSSAPTLVPVRGMRVERVEGGVWSLVVTPTADASGEATLTLHVEDAERAPAEASFLLTVRPINDPPVGQPDTFEVAAADLPLVIPAPGVLDNDADPEGDALGAALVETVSEGTLTLRPDGGFTFEGPDTLAGSFTFTYEVEDGADVSQPITVTIEVLPLDLDGDGIDAETDNCDEISNPDQADLDEDGLGDACDDDVDGDGSPATEDCDDYAPSVSLLTTWYTDDDGDGLGDPETSVTACSVLPPPGHVANADDLCPAVADADTSDADLDEDGLGDACDDDVDGDGVADDGDGSGQAGDHPCADGQREGCDDNCPRTQNPDQADSDSDASGDACADDADGDGVTLTLDACPDEPGLYADFGCPPPSPPDLACDCRTTTTASRPASGLVWIAAALVGLWLRRR